MSIVGAIGVHRRQLAFEYLDTATGELKRGPVVPPDREQLQTKCSVVMKVTTRGEFVVPKLRATKRSGWPDLNRRPLLRPELAAPLGVCPSSRLAQGVDGSSCLQLSGSVAVLCCCTDPVGNASYPAERPAYG